MNTCADCQKEDQPEDSHEVLAKAQQNESVVFTVIPTTHWDRAWYWPFERFRIKLIQLWTVVKQMWRDCPDYVFNADGQTVCVEDYLEVFPEDRELFRQMGSEGRLGVGALYCQSDVYCTGGEALIRNLQFGLASADDLCARQNVMYMPDTFGHLPEIPMICNGFGINLYVFMRGLPRGMRQDERFFRWRFADGSEVMVFRLRDGYANAAGLGLHGGTGEIMNKESCGIRPEFDMDMAIKKLNTAANTQLDGQGTPYLLNAGTDHQIPQTQLPQILKQAQGIPGKFQLGGLNDLLEQMNNRKDKMEWSRYEGEFHGDGAASILGGTISTRVYLKQNNALCEKALVHQVEPADATMVILGIEEPSSGVIHNTWKELLRCQPHDNITGCSVDAVHREDEQTFRRILAGTDGLCRRFSERLLEIYGGQQEGDERYAFFCYNFGVQRIRKLVQFDFDHEGRYCWGDMPVHDYYKIVDQNECEVPFREISRGIGDAHPHPVLRLELEVDIPAFSMRRYFLEPCAQYTPVHCYEMENQRLRATINKNGSVNLLDKKTGLSYAELGLFSDQADCGDEYDFSHIEGDHELLFDCIAFEEELTQCSSGLQTLTLCGELSIPEFSTPQGRAATSVKLPVKISYILTPESENLEIRIKLVNTASDHRLRFNVILPFTPESSHAGLKFSEVERECGQRWMKKAGDKLYAIDPIHPCDTHVALTNQDGAGIALFSDYPSNYEVIHQPQQRLALTLLRSVGMLSRESLARIKTLSHLQQTGE